jgi:DNA-binding protein Alba
LTEQKIENPNENTFIVYDDPIMDIAMEVLEKITEKNKITLKGKGKSIPTAVAVANIIESNFLKGNSKIDKIKLDSEIPDDGKMVSMIEISLEKIN